MQAKLLLTTLALLVTALAGCIGGDDTSDAKGAVVAEIHDNAAASISISGAWLQDSNEDWVPIVSDNGTNLELTDSGNHIPTPVAEVPTGEYQRLRMLFSGVVFDETDLLLQQDGIDLPITLNVVEEERSTVRLSMNWTQSQFSSQDGPAFKPVLDEIQVLQGDSLQLLLEAESISKDTAAPVARASVFGPDGGAIYVTDFVAKDPSKPLVSKGGGIHTFTAQDSEATEDGASLQNYFWDFGDGITGEGLSVEHAYPQEGGAFHVSLVVTDSEGAIDALNMLLLVKRSDREQEVIEETGFAVTGGGDQEHPIPVSTDTFNGENASLVKVEVTLTTDPVPEQASDLDMELYDPTGALVGSSAIFGSGEHIAVEYSPGSAPPSGDWVVLIHPFAAGPTNYQITVELTYLLSNPDVDAILAKGHGDHSHDH